MYHGLLRVMVGVYCLLVCGAVQAQDYWKARELLTRFTDAVENENALNISALLSRMEAQPALDYFSGLPKGISLNGELAYSECRVDYALMKKGNDPGPNDPTITVQFKEVPKGVWERFWVVDDAYDEKGNSLATKGFSLNSISGSFTELSDQVRDIANSDYLGLAPYGKLNRSYLAGRQFRANIRSTRLTFNNIQLLDSTGALVDYLYVTMGYHDYPEEWYITDIGPMSKRWLGHDRYVDFLLGLVDSLSQQPKAPPIPPPVLVQWPDTTVRQQSGDTTFFVQSPSDFDTLYYQVAREKNAFSVGHSSQLFNLRMYPLRHDADDTSTAPRERGRLALGLSLGGNRSYATVLRQYSPGNVDQSPGPSAYGGLTGLQAGLDARYQLKPKVSLALQVAYQGWGYRYQDGSLFSNVAQGTGQWVNLSYQERLHTVGFHLYGSYDLHKGEEDKNPAQAVEWVPFGEIGAGYGLMLAANGELTETVQPGAGSLDNNPQVGIFSYSAKPYRKLPYVTPSVGLGVRMETRRSDFWLVLRFRPMTWNVVHYANPNDRSLFPLSQGFYRMDDDLGLNQFALSMGYAFVFKKQR